MPGGDGAGRADAYAAAYGHDNGFEREMVRLRRDHVLASMSRHLHDRVLEIGCAEEPLFLHHDVRASHVTVEPAAAFHDAAVRLGAGRAGVRVVRGTFEDVAPSLARETFDFVVASGLLHEVSDPHAFLAALRTVASPATVAHVNVPNARSFHRLLALEMGLVASPFETSPLGARLLRRRELDEGALRGLVEGAGFRVLRFETYALKPFTHDQMEKVAASGWFPPGVVDGLARMVRYAPDLGSEMSVEIAVR